MADLLHEKIKLFLEKYKTNRSAKVLFIESSMASQIHSKH